MGCGSSKNVGGLVVEAQPTHRKQASVGIRTVNQTTHGTQITQETVSKTQYHGGAVTHQTTPSGLNTQQQSRQDVQTHVKDDQETQTRLTELSESRRTVNARRRQHKRSNELLSEEQTLRRTNVQESTHEYKHIQQQSSQKAQQKEIDYYDRKGVIITEGSDKLPLKNGTHVTGEQNDQQAADKGIQQQRTLGEQKYDIQDIKENKETRNVSETKGLKTTGKPNYGSSDLLLNHQEWRVEDTFWEGKKRNIKDYDRIRVVDKHAIDTPESLKKNSHQLVSHLVSIARSDLERYRVIFRWISHHIESDMSQINEELQVGDDSPESIIENGKGRNFSRLYNYLCQIACLECVDIEGSSKGLGYDPGEDLDTIPRGCGINHIRIDGKWFACECKWAAGHAERDEETGKYKFVRQWTEAWFLADPETCDSSHLPLNGNGEVNSPALMSPLSYKSFAEWNDNPEKKPAYFIYKMQCITHNHAVINAENNQVEIRLKCFYPMTIFTTMKKAKIGDVKPLNLPKAREYDRCVVRYFQGNEVVVVVRLPSKGDYIVGVCGYAHGISEEVRHASGNFLVGYRIRGLSSVPCPLFPERKGDIYGASWDLQLAGVQVVQPSNPIIESENGKATIELDRGESEKSLVFGYYHESDPSQKLNEYIYPECIGNKVKLNLSCPKAGMYSCVVYCKFNDEDETNNTHNFGGQFVISCPEGDPNAQAFPSDSHGLWGPNDFIHELGIKMSESMTTSTIHTENGEGSIEFLVPKGIKISHNLVNMKGENIGDTCLYAETTAQPDGLRKVNLQIRCPEVGYYRLDLYGNIENESTNAFCGRWMVICNAPYCGQVFAEGHGLWGPNTHFRKLGSEVMSPLSSTINTLEGKGELRFVVPNGVASRHKMTNVKGEEIKSTHLYAETRAKPDGSREVTLHIRCPDVGFFRLILFGDNESESNYSYCGQWMVKCTAPYCGQLFPESSGIWGPTQHSHTLGVKVVSPSCSTIQTYEGEARLILYLEMRDFLSNTFLHGLFCSNKRVANEEQCVYAMVNNHHGTFVNITYNIKVTKQGYYKFTTWSDSKGSSTYKETGKWLVRCEVPFNGNIFPKQHGLREFGPEEIFSTSSALEGPETYKKGRRLISCEVPFKGQLFPEQHGLWGPDDHFRKLGLEVVSPPSSTLEAADGLAKLKVCIKTKDFYDITLMHGLFLDDIQVENDRRCIMAEVTNKQELTEITYNIKLLKVGYYKFIIWGNPKSSKTNAEAGVWMINCNQPCQDEDIYPENWKPWGPGDEFRKLDLSVTDHDSSTLQTVDGKCRLVISSSQTFHTSCNLKTTCGEKVDSVSSKQNENGTVTEFTIRVHKAGYYSLDLFASKSPGSMPHVGQWLVIMNNDNE